MEIEYETYPPLEAARDSGPVEGAVFLDTGDEPFRLYVYRDGWDDDTPATYELGIQCYPHCGGLGAEEVDALIALLQRWRATGQLRPEGEGE